MRGLIESLQSKEKMNEKLPKLPHGKPLDDVSDVQSDLGAPQSLHQSRSGSRGTLSGSSSEFSWKNDVFLHFEVLRAGQHKVCVCPSWRRRLLSLCMHNENGAELWKLHT